MELLACFKIAPDLDLLFGGDWSMADDLAVDTRYCKYVINPYDESALELLLKLRDSAAASGDEVGLSALTVGTSAADRTLKNLYALKYDRVSRIACGADLRFAAAFVAQAVSRYVKRLERMPVVVMGNQSSEGNNAATPLLTAELLNLPCITAVADIRLSARAGYLDVTSADGGSVVVQTIEPPAVLAVGDVACSYLRVPTLKDKVHSGKKEIELLSPEELGLCEEDVKWYCDCELVELFCEKKDRACAMIEGASPEEMARTLYETYLKERIRE